MGGKVPARGPKEALCPPLYLGVHLLCGKVRLRQPVDSDAPLLSVSLPQTLYLLHWLPAPLCWCLMWGGFLALFLPRGSGSPRGL